MSPVKLHEEYGRVVLNGPRPSPLRISKDSRVIQKPSSSYPMSTDVSGQVKVTKQQQQLRQPVIIYTHSPKIIHTKPRDFMALVQKLTGFSRSDTRIAGQNTDQSQELHPKILNHEDNDSSSVTSDEKCEGENNQGVNPYVPEVPLFTPNSSHLFFSPHSLFRQPDVLVPSPSMLGSFSPSFLDFLNLKELPEY